MVPTDKIHIENLNVDNLFKSFYVVPDYQREYVWEEKNVNQLLDDIYEEFSSKQESEYFIGSIVVCGRDDKRFEVIDGQQRLTTLFACLCAFKKLLEIKGEDISDIKDKLFSTKRDYQGKLTSNYRLELQYEESTDIIQRLTEDKLTEEWVAPSSRRIMDAYLIATDYLSKNLNNHEDLTKFLGYFSNNIKLVQIETPKVSDALKIFETINERGIGLNPMDLLKNLIFRQVDKDDFEKLKIEWKKIVSTLERNSEKPLRFLRYFIMANYKVNNPKGEEIIREDEIYDWITKDANIKQCNYEKKPFDFVKFMLSNAEVYVSFLNGQDKNGNKNLYLENIKRLGGGGFRQHLILLLAAKDMNIDMLSHLAKQIESLMFYYFVTKEPTKELERKFSKWAKLIKPIQTNEELNSFIQLQIQKEVSSRKTLFTRSFEGLTSDDLQVYRIRYILAKINEYVDRNYLGSNEEKDLSGYIRKGVEIEHILPMKPEADLRKDFGEDYDLYKIKLGNLTLFEKPMNIVARNDFFQKKQTLYKDSMFYLTRSLNGLVKVGNNSSVNRINQQLKAFTNWDKTSIDSRQNMLLRLAENIWKIDALN